MARSDSRYVDAVGAAFGRSVTVLMGIVESIDNLIIVPNVIRSHVSVNGRPSRVIIPIADFCVERSSDLIQQRAHVLPIVAAAFGLGGKRLVVILNTRVQNGDDRSLAGIALSCSGRQTDHIGTVSGVCTDTRDQIRGRERTGDKGVLDARQLLNGAQRLIRYRYGKGVEQQGIAYAAGKVCIAAGLLDLLLDRLLFPLEQLLGLCHVFTVLLQELADIGCFAAVYRPVQTQIQHRNVLRFHDDSYQIIRLVLCQSVGKLFLNQRL